MKKIFLLVALITSLSIYAPIILAMTPGEVEKREELLLQDNASKDENSNSDYDSDTDGLGIFSLPDQCNSARPMIIANGLAIVSPTIGHIVNLPVTNLVTMHPVNIHGEISQKKEWREGEKWRVDEESENSDEGDSDEESSENGSQPAAQNLEDDEEPGAPRKKIEPKQDQLSCVSQPSASPNKHHYRNIVVCAGVFVAGASLGALYKHGKSLSKLLANFWNSLGKKADKIKIHLTRGRPVCKEEIQITQTQQQDIQEENIKKKAHDQLVNIAPSETLGISH